MASSFNKNPPHTLIAIVLAVVVVGAGAVVLYHTNHLPFVRSPNRFTPAITGSSYTKGDKMAQTPVQPTQPSTPSPGTPGSSKDKGAAAQPLIAPTGTFVSNHHPHLSNSPPGSDHLSSACTTTPGATCQVIFTKDGATKSLPAETADAGGSAYWNDWTPQQYGLTEGTWSVQALAVLGSQKQAAADALSLEVSP